MLDKKYYSISEVENLLKIPAHKIRYFEKKLPSFNIQKAKSRRYYKLEDINLLRSLIKNPDQLAFNLKETNGNLQERIDKLQAKFFILTNQLKAAIN